jgi:hypothetical protein
MQYSVMDGDTLCIYNVKNERCIQRKDYTDSSSLLPFQNKSIAFMKFIFMADTCSNMRKIMGREARGNGARADSGFSLKSLSCVSGWDVH